MNLKRKLSFTCILFALLITAAFIRVQAQETAFGIKGGLNLTNLKVSDPEASYDSRTGFHAGVFVRGKFSKIAIQPELLLFTQSTEVSSSLIGDYQDKFTYLSVPVMLKFYIVSGLNIHAGPQFGFLLDGDRNFEGALGSGSTDIKDYYKDTDISLSFGGGWDFPFGLSADVRYNIGVQDINEATDGEEAKSRVFQVSLGWNFLK